MLNSNIPTTFDFVMDCQPQTVDNYSQGVGRCAVPSIVR